MKSTTENIVKLVERVQVKNDLGLHTRPATVIVKILQAKKSSVTFTYRRETVNAKSILSLLMIAAQKNSKIKITIEGPEEEANKTMALLVEAFESRFGE